MDNKTVNENNKPQFAIFDWIVKYMKTLEPPMKDCMPAYALRNVPIKADTITITSKVKIIFKELLKKPKFIFNKLFSKENNTNLDIVTAFLGVLELNRRKKVKVDQEVLFGDIMVEKIKK